MTTATAGPCRPPLVEFLYLLALHLGFVVQVSNESLQRVVVLDLSVDAFVDESVTGIGQGLLLIPVPDHERVDVGVVGEYLIR